MGKGRILTFEELNLIEMSDYCDTIQQHVESGSRQIFLLFADIDRFRYFNDLYGKDIGDLLIDLVIDSVLYRLEELFSLYPDIKGFYYSTGDDMVFLIDGSDLDDGILDDIVEKTRNAVSADLRDALIPVKVTHGSHNEIEDCVYVVNDLHGFEKHDIFIHPVCHKGLHYGIVFFNEKEAGFPVNSFLDEHLNGLFDWSFFSDVPWLPQDIKINTCIFPLSITMVSSKINYFHDTKESFTTVLDRCYFSLRREKDKKNNSHTSHPAGQTSGNGENIVIDSSRKPSLPFSSERYFRQVYSRKISMDAKGTLIILKPEYRIAENGENYGVKELNNLIGPGRVDELITSLASTLTETSLLVSMTMHIDRNHFVHAVFVDTFYIYIQNRLIDRGGVFAYCRLFMHELKAKIQGICIELLHASYMNKTREMTGIDLIEKAEKALVVDGIPEYSERKINLYHYDALIDSEVLAVKKKKAMDAYAVLSMG